MKASFLLTTLLTTMSFAETIVPLAVNPDYPLGKATVYNEPFNQSISFRNNFDLPSLGCNFMVDFVIASQNEGGEPTKWYQKKFSKEVKLKKITKRLEFITLPEVDQELEYAQEWLDARQNIDNTAFVKDFGIRPGTIKCSLNRKSIKEVCEDYYSSMKGLVNTDEKNLLDILERDQRLSLSINTCADFETSVTDLSELDLSGHELKDLNLLKHFQGLEVLKLNDAPLTSLKAFTGLRNLRTLELNNTMLENADDLASLTTLENLSLAKNKLKSSYFLANLNYLVTLNLTQNKLEELDHLQSDTLKSLNASNNSILRFGFNKVPNAKVVHLENNSIGDIESIRGHKVIKLFLSGNNISDFRPGLSLSSLQEIVLAGNPVYRPNCPLVEDHSYQEAHPGSSPQTTENSFPVIIYPPVPETRYVYLEDFLNKPLFIACDEHIRKTDAEYDKYWIKMPRPVEVPNYGYGTFQLSNRKL